MWQMQVSPSTSEDVNEFSKILSRYKGTHVLIPLWNQIRSHVLGDKLWVEYLDFILVTFIYSHMLTIWKHEGTVNFEFQM